ncbi:MAG: hypothetical protein V7K18_11550 [Nostoc sp.]|uniref:hypothetical protein n=1 Tax=Nostoc sp. TaxID=1180 RepID=UPI002FF7512D
MSLQKLKEQARQLPVSVGEASLKETRLELVRAIIESLQDVPTHHLSDRECFQHCSHVGKSEIRFCT